MSTLELNKDGINAKARPTLVARMEEVQKGKELSSAAVTDVNGFLSALFDAEATVRETTDIERLVELVANCKPAFPQEIKELADTLVDKWKKDGTLKGALARRIAKRLRAEQPAKYVASSTASVKEPTATRLEKRRAEESFRPDLLPPPKRRPRARKAKKAASSAAIAPAVNHAIWGQQGIMWGLMLKNGQEVINYQAHPTVSSTAQERGDNGLTVGQWWPRVHLAKLHGAHDEVDKVVAGDKLGTAACSILVSQFDRRFQQDDGDTIHFCTISPNENVAQAKLDAKAGERLMEGALLNKTSIRVLRVSHCKTCAETGKKEDGDCVGKNPASEHAPACGVRYDGLYEIVGFTTRGASGGHDAMKRFKLERMADQPALATLTAPSEQQQTDYKCSFEPYY